MEDLDFLFQNSGLPSIPMVPVPMYLLYKHYQVFVALGSIDSVERVRQLATVQIFLPKSQIKVIVTWSRSSGAKVNL